MNNNKIDTIYIDMDGVLVDFVGGVNKLFIEKGLIKDPIIHYEDGIEDKYGVSNNKFWQILEENGYEFWSSLQPFPWYMDLYNQCTCLCSNVYILSTPSYDKFSAAAKINWLNKWFKEPFRNYIFTPHKELCAKPTALLIDDREHVVEKFIKAGGQAFVIPQTYNYFQKLLNIDTIENLQKDQIYYKLPRLLLSQIDNNEG